jgi:transposase
MSTLPDPSAFVERFTLFLGFDWASDHHDVVAVDATGRIRLDRSIDDTAEGWSQLRRHLLELAPADAGQVAVAVAVETCNGPAVDRLLEMGCAVYPLNPNAAKQYRSRKSPSGAKSDRLDAWSFADALRTDGHGWKRLLPDDALTQELRLLCRDEVKLIEQRTALVLQLKAALHEYYPAAMQAFEDWVSPNAWAFIERFPTPEQLVRSGRRRWEKFLHTHPFSRPEHYARRLEIFARAQEFCGSSPVTSAKSRLALALVAQLQLVDKQIRQYRVAIEEHFNNHPDRDIFGSLPGAGRKIAPRLLGEMGSIRQRFCEARELQAYAGTAPVTHQSGQSRHVVFRHACNKHLRAAVQFLADLSRSQCVWAQVYYQRKRDQGASHAAALRCLGQRWLKILWKMWQTRTTYDEGLHTRNQTQHGSWVVSLNQEAAC